MFCPKCGNQLPDGAAFCSQCGNKIAETPVAPVAEAPVAPVVEAPVAPVETPAQPAYEAPVYAAPVAPATSAAPAQPPKKKGKGLLIAIIAIVAALAVAAGALYFTGVFDDLFGTSQSDKDDKDDKDDKKGDKDGDGDGDDDEKEAASAEDVAVDFVKAEVLEDYVSQFDLAVFDYEAMLKDNVLNNYDSEDEFFEEMSDEYDENITSWKKVFSVILKDAKEYFEDTYGDDYKLKVKATDTEELDEDEIEEVIDYLLDECDGYVDEDALENIKEAMNVTVEVSVSGSRDDDAYTIIVTVVKIDGKWKVADYDYGYSADYDDEDYDYDDEDYDYDDDYYYDEY